MDAKSAARFKQHAERIIEELALALTLAKEASPTDEFLKLRTAVDYGDSALNWTGVQGS